MTAVRDQLMAAARQLSGIADRPRFEAELIWADVLGLGRAGLIAADDSTLTPERIMAAQRLVDRRCRGEPMAYVLGRREFWSLPLSVTTDTLIPRPETEGLVEWALLEIPADRDCRIADLGTGTGAIALAIASERPRTMVAATDFSAGALEVARRNALALGLGNVRFHTGDWFAAVEPGSIYDLIASNPPYIAEGDPHLHDLRFEPDSALVSGVDGLDAIRGIVNQGLQFLRAGGWLMLEHGAGQGEAVRRLMSDSGYAGVTTRRDLAGHERLTGGRRP